MSVSKNLKDFLDGKGVKYEMHQHPISYTAAETAGNQHVPGKQFVKAVIIKADGKYSMCVLSAANLLDFDKLKDEIGAEEMRLATEDELSQLFPDYELGAEPPFGNMHGLNVYADSELEENNDIWFNGGTHTDTVKILFNDYKRLAKPEFRNFTKHI